MGLARSRIQEARVELYRSKGSIHPRAVSGRFNTLRWAMVWITQIVFYGACWLQWEAPEGTRQALWFDLPERKLHLFGLVLWPQDALLFALALILAAVGLFFVTALAGRVFCGFACPQTVYTQLFTWIEARVEGDHLARLRLDNAPMSPPKFARKALKHALWALLAAWTAITFVGYFTPIRELLPAIAAFSTGPWEAFWLIFYAAFTYVQAGLAREAVCQHMCPYSRFQGVMTDTATRVVSYDAARGEPRGSLRASGATGDCVDCGLCVQVCPTGIDIRDGQQYACINCGLCIDACEPVMARIGAPAGLIRYASENELAARPAPRHGRVRPRLAVYAGLLAVTTLLLGWNLLDRSLLQVNVLRDRSALMRELPDGRVENVFLLKLVNLDERPHRYVVAVEGLP
ncbi:MAG: cytochrome c oxidase accessory protein CcoG, partial [Zoogloeaceae bacterium]|nr:cytochrome c oxidase accessory protein CcoG [Zoogloeaceae bacterium]